jgi:hypothetical protein
MKRIFHARNDTPSGLRSDAIRLRNVNSL